MINYKQEPHKLSHWFILKAKFKCFESHLPKHQRVEYPADALKVQSLFAIELFHYCKN